MWNSSAPQPTRWRNCSNDLLEISRIGRIVSAPVGVTLRILVDDALVAVAGSIAERGVTVQVDDRDLACSATGSGWRRCSRTCSTTPASSWATRRHLASRSASRCAARRRCSSCATTASALTLATRPKVFGLFEKLDPQAEGRALGCPSSNGSWNCMGAGSGWSPPEWDRARVSISPCPPRVNKTNEGEKP